MSTSPEQASLTKELSLLDGFYVLAKRRWLIIVLTLLALAIGIFSALTAPKMYTSNAVLVREAQQESSGGGLSALRGLGLNLGNSSTGLTIEAYPSILTSREVQAAIIHESLPTASGEAITLIQYRELYKRGGGPLSSLKRFLRGSSDAQLDRGIHSDSFATSYTVDELKAMGLFGEMIKVGADAETGLMTISVTARDPVFAANLAGRAVAELRTRVQAIITQKARADYEFIQQKTQEAESTLSTARAVLARFDDRNRGLTSAQLIAQRERLRQEVVFATEVYGESQSELKRAELEVQRANPVVTVLDRPVVPHLPSAPRKAMIVMIAFLAGLCGSVLLAFVLEGLQAESGSPDGEQKRAAIRDMLVPKRFRKSGSLSQD